MTGAIFELKSMDLKPAHLLTELLSENKNLDKNCSCRTMLYNGGVHYLIRREIV